MQKETKSFTGKCIYIFMLIFISIRIINAQQNYEFLIDTNVVYVPVPYKQISPSVAFDGTNYFIVWSDFRDGSEYDIFGARMNSSGIIIDTPGILISGAEGYQLNPYVIFDGTNYFVVWEDQRSGEGDIYGARITSSGMVLDVEGIPISTAINEQYFPSLSFDGTNYMVVWTDFRSGGNADIYATCVSTSGRVLDPSGIPVAIDTMWEYSPSVEFDGTNYFIVWTEYTGDSLRNDIYGVRVNITGTVIDTQKIPISTALDNQFSPFVAFDGINYFVVWEDKRNGNYDIYAARVSPSGEILDTAGIPVSTAVNAQYSPSVSFDGTNYFVAWSDIRNDADDIYGARVTPSGTVLDTGGIIISNASDKQYAPSLISGVTDYLVVWTDWRRGAVSDIYGARITQSGEVIDPNGIIISNFAYSQNSPSAAFDGTNYFIVWSDYRNESIYPDIYGIRIDTSGMIIDPTGIPVSTASYGQYSPSIAFDGVNYLIVWANGTRLGSYNIYGARVNTSGTVLDPSGFPISTAPRSQKTPCVVFGQVEYLVVWQDDRNSSNDIYGARVDTSGILLDTTGIPISAGIWWESSPSAAFDGVNYFVVWEDGRNNTYSHDIYGARVTPLGEIIDTAGIPISTATDEQKHPSITFDGTNYFVVWEDYRNGSPDIYGARVNTAGEVLDTNGIPISTAIGIQCYPSAMFNGQNYVVVWEDYRNGHSDIYGAYVNISGQVINTFPLSVQLGNQFSPSLAHGSNSWILVTYSGWTGYINNRPANTMRIWGKFRSGVNIEETGRNSDISFIQIINS